MGKPGELLVYGTSAVCGKKEGAAVGATLDILLEFTVSKVICNIVVAVFVIAAWGAILASLSCDGFIVVVGVGRVGDGRVGIV